MTILFQDDYKTGDLARWGFTSTPSPTVQSAVTYNNEPYAEKVTDTGVGNFQTFAGKDLGSDQSTVYVSANVQVTALPDVWNTLNVLPIRDANYANGVDAAIINQPTGAVWCVIDNNGNAILSAIPVQIGVFYNVVLERTVGTGANGVIQLWINNILAAASTTATITTGARFVYAGTSWNGSVSTNPQTVYYADFQADDVYPSNSTVNPLGPLVSTLTLTASPTSGVVPWSSTFSGSLVDSNGAGIPGAAVYLQGTLDGINWMNMGISMITDASGNYTASIEFTAANGWAAGVTENLRAVFDATTIDLACVSNNVTITCVQTTPPTNQYTLTITAASGGTTSPAPNVYTEDAGTVVNVTPIPDSNDLFDHWVLDGVNNTTKVLAITMNDNHTLQAVFVAIPPALSNNNDLIIGAIVLVGIGVILVTS